MSHRFRKDLDDHNAHANEGWEGSDVNQQRVAGTRCSADYTFKSVEAEIHVDHN